MIIIKKLKFQLVIFSVILTLFSFLNSNIYGAESLNLLCTSDIVMDYDSGKILYSKEINQKVYPASTTKILTAILVIEKMDLNTAVVVSKNAVDSTPYRKFCNGSKS